MNIRRQLNTILAVFLLLVLTGFHFLYSIRTNIYFSQDDFAFLAYFKQYPFPDMVARFITIGDPWGFRKVLGYILLRIMFILFGTNHIPFILLNHSLHSINVILVFFIIEKLTFSRLKSFFFALVFGHVYLMYFSNIHEYLVTTLLLSTTLSFMHNKTLLSLFFLILGLTTKELAIVAVLLILAVNSLTKGSNKPKTLPFTLVAILYLLFQFSFFLSRSRLPLDHPYVTTLHLPTLWHNFLFYFSNKYILVLLISLPFALYKKTWLFLFTFTLSIVPALILKNRQEAYYLYLPLSLMAIYLATTLPKIKLSTFPLYLLFFYLLGSRQLLPPLVWQNFPSWQVHSIQTVLNKVTKILNDAPNTTAIDLSTVDLQRDANLLLGSQVIEYFLPRHLSQKYIFKYNLQTHVLEIKSL